MEAILFQTKSNKACNMSEISFTKWIAYDFLDQKQISLYLDSKNQAIKLCTGKHIKPVEVAFDRKGVILRAIKLDIDKAKLEKYNYLETN